jgi:hypothetical protein
LARRRRKGRLRLVLFVILVLAVCGSLELRHMMTYEPQYVVPPSPVRAAEARKAVSEVRRRVSKVSAAARRGRRVPYQVSVNDDDLTSYVATDKKTKARLAAKGIRDARFHFDDGRVRVSGFLNYHGQKVYATLSGKPVPGIDGKIRFVDVGVQLGKVNAPVLIGKAQGLIDEMFQSGVAPIPPGIRQITAQGGELTLIGVTRPE